jgi:hypothetical protein
LEYEPGQAGLALISLWLVHRAVIDAGPGVAAFLSVVQIIPVGTDVTVHKAAGLAVLGAVLDHVQASAIHLRGHRCDADHTKAVLTACTGDLELSVSVPHEIWFLAFQMPLNIDTDVSIRSHGDEDVVVETGRALVCLVLGSHLAIHCLALQTLLLGVVEVVVGVALLAPLGGGRVLGLYGDGEMAVSDGVGLADDVGAAVGDHGLVGMTLHTFETRALFIQGL